MRAYIKPLAVLAATLAFALWNGAVMTRSHRPVAGAAGTGGRPGPGGGMEPGGGGPDGQLHRLVRQADLPPHRYRTRCRGRRRGHVPPAMAFAATRELTEFRAELADLRDQLRLLAEMERFSVKNVL